MKNLISFIVFVFVLFSTVLACDPFEGSKNLSFVPYSELGTSAADVYHEGSTELQNFFAGVLSTRRDQYVLAWGENFVQWLENTAEVEGWVCCLKYGTISNSGIDSQGGLCSGSAWTGHCVAVRKGSKFILLAKYANFKHKPLQSTDNGCLNADYVRKTAPNGGITPPPPPPQQCSLGMGVITASSNVITFNGMNNVLKVIVDGFEFSTNRLVTASFNHSLVAGPHVAYYYCDNATFKGQQSFNVAEPTPPPSICELAVRTSKTIGDSIWSIEVKGMKEVNGQSSTDFTFTWGNGDIETIPSQNGKASFTIKDFSGVVSLKVIDNNVKNCSLTPPSKNMKSYVKPVAPVIVYKTQLTLNNICDCKHGDLTFSGPTGSSIVLIPQKEGGEKITLKTGETKNITLKQVYNFEVKMPNRGDLYTLEALGDGSKFIRTANHEDVIDMKDCRKCKKSGTGWWIAGGTAGAAILTALLIFAVGNGG